MLYALVAAMMAVACSTGAGNEAKALDDADTLAIMMADEALFDGDDEEEKSERTLPRTIDETFDDFIFNFASRERFQLSRISFPLHLNAFGDDFVVERKEWTFQSLFSERDYYTVFFCRADDADIEKDTTLETVRFENINLRDSIVRTLRFDKQDGRWMLTRQLLTRLEAHRIAGFLLFYQRFASDSCVCRRALCESIRYTTDDPDDDFTRIVGSISADQWSAFAPELPQDEITNIDFGQPFDDANHVVMLKHGISDGMYDELHFRRESDGWKLTAYEN